MRNFYIIRVPVTLDEKRNPTRRQNFGQSPTIVGEADTRAEVASKVAQLSFGDKRHHYYGLELVAMGDADRKSPILVGPPKPPKGGRPKLAVVNDKKEKRA